MNNKSIILLIALSISLSANADLSSGLVAYYPFNGNANDESGNGNNGTVYGATLTADRFGNENSAYSFDGNLSYIEILNSQSLNLSSAITMVMWINFNQINRTVDGYDWQAIITKDSPAKSYGLMQCTDSPHCNNINSLTFYTQGLSQSAQSYNWSDLLAKSWQFIVLTYDGLNSRFYINGTLKNSFQNSGNIQTNSSNLVIGRSTDAQYPWTYPMDGKLDDIRIYNRALSAAEIQQLYLENTTHQLTITKTGTGSGIITSNPAGINCGEDCSENYLTGSNVTLTATPDPINTWGGWGGDCTGTANTCTVNMDKARNVTAAFNQILPPTTTTGEATTVTQTSATLNGTVTSPNATAAASFDFGTTNTYGINIAATPAQVYSSTPVAVSANTTDLTCGTTYHFRTKAVASSGTALGINQTFTTAACVVNSWLYPATHTVLKNQSFTLDITVHDKNFT